MGQLLVVLLRLSMLVLLPIVPAFILFKALPSRAIVSGPLQGLNIKLGGSFGAYFAVLLVLISAHSVWDPVLVQVWTVDGNVLDENGQPFQLLQTSDILVNAPPVSVVGPGSFHVEFAAQAGPTGDLQYPTIAIAHDALHTKLIELQRGKPSTDPDLTINWDSQQQSVSISRVVLHSLPPYNPTGPAPAPIAPSR